MDQREGRTTAARLSLKRKLEAADFEDQNQGGRKLLVIEDGNKDVQLNSAPRSASSTSAQTLPSSSKPRSNCWNYDVFLSFRGEDTRKNFTDHLYSALVQAGIHTFRDDDELRRGENISTELLNAIRGSRISIAVFSKGYASSSWCLDELAEILRSTKTKGQTLLPVFYDVNPSDVRKQTGTFAQAFARHEERFRADMERVQRWRAALTEAADLSGWDLESVANGYESRFIEEIVEEVLLKVNRVRLQVAMHPIGIDSRVEEMKALFNLKTSDVCILGIYGMGGSGKTTLAKALYNQICDEFEGSSCLLNIKEVSGQLNGLVHLQEQLLYDILKIKNVKIHNVEEGIKLIEKRIQSKRVLVILDDVDHLKQLQALVGNCKWFRPGSKVIATTRDEQLLTQLGVHGKYKVTELNHFGVSSTFLLACLQDGPSKRRLSRAFNSCSGVHWRTSFSS
ncbi:TMV resistance protein N [Morella rubra]|uniref:TMV resistance protein N n=1 Tax=Morella rubra TaxID=262757 RepID=A0A6A1WXD7_9ROSI|nr:TMV resistance protein N [Morella rubra]